jgi:hypothetical protein
LSTVVSQLAPILAPQKPGTCTNLALEGFESRFRLSAQILNFFFVPCLLSSHLLLGGLELVVETLLRLAQLRQLLLHGGQLALEQLGLLYFILVGAAEFLDPRHAPLLGGAQGRRGAL